MNSQSAAQVSFGFLGRKPVVVEVADCQLTSDAGLLPIREFDEFFGFTRQFADAIRDLRRSGSVTHSCLEMARSRIYGILADYEDQNDHDTLRHDPVFKVINGVSLEETLASQPTHSRFENSIDIPSLNRLRDVLIDQFIDSFDSTPNRITLDIDTFDDPTHGDQQLTFFHGYYDQYQYQSRIITCAENDMAVMPCLLFGTAAASLGAADDLKYLVDRLRAVWPDLDIEFRADSGFGVPEMFEMCERLRVWYTIGFGMNSVLKEHSNELMSQVLKTFEETGEPQRCFMYLTDYQSRSWTAPRLTIIKCEANHEGINRRVIITNRPGTTISPKGIYEAYADHGECENRNKELKCGFHTDRLSDHRYMANLFRLYLHLQAHNLLIRVRNYIAVPVANPDPELPSDALPGPARKRLENRRRRSDPLGVGHPATWRTRLIKVAAEVVERARCIRIKLPSNWPWLGHYQAVSKAAMALNSLQIE